MVGKLMIDGKEFEVDVTEAILKSLTASSKKTGYERVADNQRYYYNDGCGSIMSAPESSWASDDAYYQIANYYSDKTIAENNARADKLMRNLRRFAAEHNVDKINKNYVETDGAWVIRYDNGDAIAKRVISRYFGDIYFDSFDTAMGAITRYHDELLWYFMEYKESL